MNEELCLYPDSGKVCILLAFHDNDHEFGPPKEN